MNRRNFLKYLAFLGANFAFTKDILAQSKKELAISEGKDYEKITKNAIDALGGISKFVKKGDVVVIKPNIGWDRKPEEGANTHPLVVKAVTEECLKAGARKVKIFDRTCNDPRRCYVNSGMANLLQNIKGVELKHLDNEKYKNYKINGVFIKEWELYEEAINCDVYINIPVAKHHGLTGLTLALKNIMGIMGGNRGYIHREIEESLCDFNSFVKIHLHIVDATRILLRNGPQGGGVKDVKILNTVLASTDPVLADAYATTLFGIKPEEISITKRAYERGLGEININRAKIIKV
ncbi:MAG: DUF362 domain-containing protein [Proteobacteria bacterium]|nr:DUF362 domain-containing protein [Pseudomonadota bacterium]